MQLDPVFAPAHADLIYELESRGFVAEPGDVWRGEVTAQAGAEEISIEFPDTYPVSPPVVKRAAAHLDWHQNPNGSLCLWSSSEPGHFPWLQHGGLIGRITEWLDLADAGWQGQSPDLDLDRYWPPSTRYRMVVLPQVPMDDGWLRLDVDRHFKVLKPTGRQAPPRSRPKSHTHRYALIVSIGEPARPMRDWDDLKALLAEADDVESALRSGLADILIVQYVLGGQHGAFALSSPARRAVDLRVEATPVASNGPNIRQLRSGYLSSQLSSKRVCVVGVGSVGSFVAEGLARAGVGHIQLLDGGRLRPGHLPRHAARGPLGWPKTAAVALLVHEYGCAVESTDGALVSVSAAREILSDADLVVDATANEVVTELLRVASVESGRQFVCTYLMNDGRTMVADIVPAVDGQQLTPHALPRLAPSKPESGCGDLVSPTAPYAVQETATMAVRLAISLLCPGSSTPLPEAREHTW